MGAGGHLWRGSVVSLGRLWWEPPICALRRAGLVAQQDHGARIAYVYADGSRAESVMLHLVDGPIVTDGSAMWQSMLGLSEASSAALQVVGGSPHEPQWKGLAGLVPSYVAQAAALVERVAIAVAALHSFGSIEGVSGCLSAANEASSSGQAEAASGQQRSGG